MTDKEVKDLVKRVWQSWDIEDCIGVGSYAKVYKAVRRDIGAVSAIKVLRIPDKPEIIDTLIREYGSKEGAREYCKTVAMSFVDEIKLLESFKGHPNICGIEDYSIFINDDGISWSIIIRMEMLTPLNPKTFNATEENIIKLAKDILSALSACESLNIIHRDVKPGNILMNNFGSYKLCDFGIAKSMDNAQNNMSINKGTPYYIAPEVTFSNNYDSSVDVYSLGVMLYQLANNNLRPFETEVNSYNDNNKALNTRLSGKVPIPRPSGVSEQLGDIILKACAFRVEDRYSSADEMLNVLERYAKGESIAVPKEKSGSPAKLIIGIVAAFIAFCCVLGFTASLTTKGKGNAIIPSSKNDIVSNKDNVVSKTREVRTNHGDSGMYSIAEYNSDNELIKDTYYYSDDSIGRVDEYNDSKMIKRTYYSNGVIERSSEYEYLSSDEVIEHWSYAEGTYKDILKKSNVKVSETEFNKDHIITKKTDYDQEGNFLAEYYYDENGNLIVL